jgi:hypothetical protein
MCDRAVRLARRPPLDAPATWPTQVYNENLVYSLLERPDSAGRTETDHLLEELGFIGPQEAWRDSVGSEAVAFLHEQALQRLARDPRHGQERLDVVDALGAIRDAAASPGFKARVARGALARMFDPARPASRLQAAVASAGGTPPTQAVLEDIAASFLPQAGVVLAQLQNQEPDLPVATLVARVAADVDPWLVGRIQSHQAAVEIVPTLPATPQQKEMLTALGRTRALDKAQLNTHLQLATSLNRGMRTLMATVREDDAAQAVPVLLDMLNDLEVAGLQMPGVPTDELLRRALDLALAGGGIDSQHLRREMTSPTGLRLMRGVANSPDTRHATMLPELLTALAGTGFGATAREIQPLAEASRQDIDLGDPLLMRSVYGHAQAGIDHRGVIRRKGYGHLLQPTFQREQVVQRHAEMGAELGQVEIRNGLSKDFRADTKRSKMYLNGIQLPVEPDALLAHFPDDEAGRTTARMLSLCMGQSTVLAVDDVVRQHMRSEDGFVMVGSHPCVHSARELSNGDWEVESHMAVTLKGVMPIVEADETVLPAGLHTLYSVTTRVPAAAIRAGEPRVEFVRTDVTFSL